LIHSCAGCNSTFFFLADLKAQLLNGVRKVIGDPNEADAKERDQASRKTP
jgi:hypothetical protein